VRDTLKAAGFEGRRLGASTLRQSAATALHDGLTEAGLPDALRRVQAFLGHSQQSTTEGYLDRRQHVVLQRDTAARGILTPASTPTRVALSNVFNILTGEPVTA
jgi:integrase